MVIVLFFYRSAYMSLNVLDCAERLHVPSYMHLCISNMQCIGLYNFFNNVFLFF